MAESSHTEPRLDVRDATLSLTGEISFHTVTHVLDEGRRVIAALGERPAVLDLSAVSRADSAGLALVVDWARVAKRGGSQLQITGVPPQLADIARVSGLEKFLAGV